VDQKALEGRKGWIKKQKRWDYDKGVNADLAVLLLPLNQPLGKRPDL